MSFTYASVDEGSDPVAAADWQERIDAWPAVRAYKDHMLGFVPGEGTVLDVGCGPGTDLVEIGADRAVGVDPSVTMCRRAATRGVLVLRGDGGALPFAAGSFAASRADRVLQHVDDPDRVLAELVRVTRPGGVIVVADPDQETLTIHVAGVPEALVDRVKALRRDVGYRNGRLASRLPARFTELGLRDIRVEAFTLVVTDPADAFGLATWPRSWRERGVADFADDELEQWEAALGTRTGLDHSGFVRAGFVYAVSYLVTAGRRAEPTRLGM